MQVATDRADQRYIGDSESRVVHDTFHEDPTPNGCNIRMLLRSGKAVRFDPDRLRQAHAEEFVNCERCLYRLDARPGMSSITESVTD